MESIDRNDLRAHRIAREHGTTVDAMERSLPKAHQFLAERFPDHFDPETGASPALRKAFQLAFAVEKAGLERDSEEERAFIEEWWRDNA